MSYQEAAEFNGMLHQISETAVGLRNLLPNMAVLEVCQEQDIKIIVRMVRLLPSNSCPIS